MVYRAPKYIVLNQFLSLASKYKIIICTAQNLFVSKLGRIFIFILAKCLHSVRLSFLHPTPSPLAAELYVHSPPGPEKSHPQDIVLGLWILQISTGAKNKTYIYCPKELFVVSVVQIISIYTHTPL